VGGGIVDVFVNIIASYYPNLVRYAGRCEFWIDKVGLER